MRAGARNVLGTGRNNLLKPNKPMKTKDFYRVDYFPANNKGAGHFIGFFDDYYGAIAEIPHNYSQIDDRLTEEWQRFNAHYTLTTYTGMANMTPEQAWEEGYILTDDTFIIND